MASIDYSFVTQASADAPVAYIAPKEQQAVVGSVVRLDGRASYSPTGLNLTYQWSFKQVPIGSQVELDGFQSLEDDDSVMSFAPDVTGPYEIQLVVNDGSFDSLPVVADVVVKILLVPHNEGIVPDTSWIWNYLSDFWARVEQRSRFETFWSSAIQIIAAEQLKLWQYDYNKSIKDIQEVVQKRWLHYDPLLPLDLEQVSFILADDQAGNNAATFVLDPNTAAPAVPQPQSSNIVSIPATEGDFAKTSYGKNIATGRLLEVGHRSFTLSRTGTQTRSVSTGIDGAVTSGSSNFDGSAFTADMVGMRLKITSGSLSGTSYLINSFTSSTRVSLRRLDGSSFTFSATVAELRYSIFPSSPNFNSFFADLNQVQAGQAALPWRFSATLSSTQYDFEQEGVQPGDVLRVEIFRIDNQRSSQFNAQIVSVDRGRIGFVMNTDDLLEGVAARGISSQDQVSLATDLQVNGLRISTVDQSLVYTDQAAVIYQTVRSAAFKRQYYETAMDPDSTVNLGPFSISIRPLQVIRNSAVRVDNNIRSIPSLQEYIKQPEIIEQDGQLLQLAENLLYPITHRPYVLLENLDYVLDNETTVTGTATIAAGDDTMVLPFGDLLARSIRPGDTIVLTDNINDFPFTILSVTTAETLRVSPVSPKTLAAVKFTVHRRVEGNFLRFVGSSFTKKNPAPNRIWAEVTFFDNNDTVESNFGVLVGVRRSDLSSVGATISYKNAVAGLMFALTNGPTVSNLQLASQILLGLPFTTNPGTIIEIDPSFKTNADGSPLQGRILIAAENDRGNKTGITNIFFYPQGRQTIDPSTGKWVPVNPELSGLATNPDTGVPYAVGDRVNKFVGLSRGTQVQDYLTTSGLVQQFLNQGNSAFALQRYHSFQLLVNADITTAIDTDLVAQFIRKAKPTYTKLSLALGQEFEDVINVDDSLLFKRPVFSDDNISLSLPVSVSFDPQGIDGAYVTAEGEMFSYRLFGGDLVTTQSSLQVTSASGGFINARAWESHGTDFIKKGHLLKIFEGPNAGDYLVESVDSDTALTLQTLDHEGETFNFQTQTAQTFAVFMPIQAFVASGTGSITNSSNTINLNFGIQCPGVAVGDLVVFLSGVDFSRIYHIAGVDIANNRITTVETVVEGTGIYNVGIYREGLLSQHFGQKQDTITLSMEQTSGNKTGIITTASVDTQFIPLLMMPGDVIVNPTTSEEFFVIDFDPPAQKVSFEPAASNTGVYPCRLERQSRSETVISTDILDRMPADSLFLKLRRRATGSGGAGPDLTTTASSATVSTVSGENFDTGLKVQAGDYLVVLEGADSSIDVGYGPGIYPILEVQATNLLLARALTTTNNAPGILFGIQRRRPNERTNVA